MPQLNCPQLNKTIKVDPNKSIMNTLLSQGIQVASSCGGDGICGKCKMKIKSQSLPALSNLEERTLAKNDASPDERLSCQLQIQKDATVETTYW